jgi:hypothetical protein
MLQVYSRKMNILFFFSIFYPIDYIIPPSENNAIFIMTNFIQVDQTRSSCPESVSLSEAVCEKDTDCQNRPFSPKINGLWTGRCLFSSNAYLVNGTINFTRKQTGLCEYAGKLTERLLNESIIDVICVNVEMTLMYIYK